MPKLFFIRSHSNDSDIVRVRSDDVLRQSDLLT